MNEINNIYSPLFSVVVPAYNSVQFIDKCIRSVIEQTCTDFELVLVDDGSTDETFFVCKSYAEKDFRIKVFHKENGGHTSARNYGLNNSVGRYIIFLDSDDWLDIGTLESCQNEILEHDSDIVIFRMKNSTDIMPFPIGITDGYYEIDELETLVWNNLILDEDGKFVFPKSLSAKCFKRESILYSQLSVPKEIMIGEDGAAFVSAMLGASCVSVIADDELACYNCFVRPNSVSRSSDVNAFKRVLFLLEFYRKLLSTVQMDFSQQLNRYVVAQLYTSVLLVIRSDSGTKELNCGMSEILQIGWVSEALKNAKFGLKGYKFLIKKFILRYRLWWLAMLLDR